ncbi:hypothetical protein [Domibacillus epiphyticus]|uniref:Uncharacterized protein n=1 Tax=Domibacillus epiphyticus TaxID=1714355 RepID=A0A1V2ACJ8_9BACI|nr:hypothetical protein [Domibacillus epiphyticus]OMP68726.1 hypothetical protein BTO28_01365 [Domibacillus epiphyticus]
MSKLSTKSIQSELCKIGQELGLHVKQEYSFKKVQGMYAPRYDVVWLLDVSEFAVHEILSTSLIDGQYIPFTAFEIEGSTTSSKNQLGNVGNLKLSPCFFNFLVVDNAAAGKENDTYRRAMKIVRTIQRVMGERPLFLLDACMLENLPKFEKTFSRVNAEKKARLKGSGGEKGSIPVAEKLFYTLGQSNLQIDYDFTPDYFKWAFHLDKKYMPSKQFTFDPVSFEQKDVKQDSQYYYKPKIDIVAGFYIGGGFVDFLKEIALRLKSDAVHFPLLQYALDKQLEELYFPLLGIEIEMKESKHALGGLMNLTNFHQFGWVVAPAEMGPYIETYKHHLGMQNIEHIQVEEL